MRRSLSGVFDVCVSNATQFIYLLLLNIWMFSFLPEARALFDKKHYNLIAQITRSLNTYDSEKIIRVVVAIVENLIGDAALVEELLADFAIRKLNLLNQRIFKDHDISETLRVVLDKLNADYDVLTSFDLYEKEIASGELHCGPRHSVDFWKENVRAFEADDFKLVKRLIELVDSKDEETVCVACSDLSYFAAFYPNGKKCGWNGGLRPRIVAKYQGKDKIMALLASDNKKIVEAALSACSRLMINKWEDLEKK